MALATKKMFLDQVFDRPDKWCVIMLDGSEPVYKHLYSNGREQLADMVCWKDVMVIGGRVQAFSI